MSIHENLLQKLRWKKQKLRSISAWVGPDLKETNHEFCQSCLWCKRRIKYSRCGKHKSYLIQRVKAQNDVPTVSLNCNFFVLMNSHSLGPKSTKLTKQLNKIKKLVTSNPLKYSPLNGYKSHMNLFFPHMSLNGDTQSKHKTQSSSHKSKIKLELQS